MNWPRIVPRMIQTPRGHLTPRKYESHFQGFFNEKMSTKYKIILAKSMKTGMKFCALLKIVQLQRYLKIGSSERWFPSILYTVTEDKSTALSDVCTSLYKNRRNLKLMKPWNSEARVFMKKTPKFWSQDFFWRKRYLIYGRSECSNIQFWVRFFCKKLKKKTNYFR